MKNTLKKTAKGATVAMGIFSSFFSSTVYSSQTDVHSVMQQVKQTSDLLIQQNVEERYFFSVLAELNEKIALLNSTVRAMKKPEKTIQDIVFMDTGLNLLAKKIRQKHLDFLKTNPSARDIFKQYNAEIFKFSVFTEKMREKTNFYSIVPSHSNFTNEDLAELIANSNKRA